MVIFKYSYFLPHWPTVCCINGLNDIEIPSIFAIVLFSLNSKGSVRLYNVPIGGKIPELSHFKPQEDERAWPKELAVSALYFTGELKTVTKHPTVLWNMGNCYKKSDIFNVVPSNIRLEWLCTAVYSKCHLTNLYRSQSQIIN